MTEKLENTMRGESDETKKGQECSENKTRDCDATSSSKGSGDDTGKTTSFAQWPWLAQFLLALVIIIAVLVLLVGLPTASMLVAEKMSSGSELSGTVSFWGALFAAFISLVVTFIAGVFAFTAFKVEGNAAQEARRTARKEARYAAKREARKIAEKQCAEIVRGAAHEYIIENIEDEKDGKKKRPRGEKIIQEAADGYVADKGPDITQEESGKCAKSYLEENGAGVTRGVAQSYIREAVGEGAPPRGDKIIGQAANDYMHHNGPGIAREAAEDCSRSYYDTNGKKITEEAAVAFVNQNGTEINRTVADGYIREDIGQEGEALPRGDKVARQAADSYVRGVVDDYASGIIQGEDMTRVEKMTRDVVKTTGTDEFSRLVDERLTPEVARLVDEYLASLRLVDRLRIGSGRRRRRNEAGSAGEDGG
ncbi:MAG: hypothetical protein OXE97_11265 [Gammaproteobacteria bacterium]|nr:hypothetical protein [Gammaproteobacteria bacterium]